MGMQGLENAFNYMVREICMLWEQWLYPTDDSSFVLDSMQASRGWNFIRRLMIIVINREPAVAKSNIQALTNFVQAWRPRASEADLSACVKDICLFLKRKKKIETDEDTKELKLLWKTGLQLMNFFLSTEVVSFLPRLLPDLSFFVSSHHLHTSFIRAFSGCPTSIHFSAHLFVQVDMLSDRENMLREDWVHLSYDQLKELLTAALPLLQPATDANKVASPTTISLWNLWLIGQ